MPKFRAKNMRRARRGAQGSNTLVGKIPKVPRTIKIPKMAIKFLRAIGPRTK